VRSALAKGLEIDGENIHIDYGTKIVTVDCDPAVTLDAIAKALEGSDKYRITQQPVGTGVAN
jgi:hypothetical protein